MERDELFLDDRQRCLDAIAAALAFIARDDWWRAESQLQIACLQAKIAQEAPPAVSPAAE